MACSQQESPVSVQGPIAYSRVQQIFNTRCAGGACHVDSLVTAENLDLTEAVATSNLLNVAAVQDPKRVRVKPGQPDASYLMCKVDPGCAAISGTHMPITEPLSAQDLAVLRLWIAEGALGGSPLDGGTTPGADVTPPTFAGATAATSAPNSITVSWAAATDDRTAASQLTYLLYQASAAGAETFATPSYVTAPGATSYAVGQLPINKTYYYVVRARDAAGNVDANKVEVSATTPAISDMQPPTFAGLASATAASGSITLSWSAASDNVSAANQLVYLVYQATAPGGESYATPSYTTLPGATSYVVSNLSPNTTYYFVVRAQDTAGNIAVNTIEKSAKTAALSFSGQVQPIFTATCTGPACHSGAKPQQGLNLSSAASSYAGLVNIASQQCPTTKLVLPLQPDMSYMVWKIQGAGTCFTGSQMPKGAPLSAAQIATIRSWVSAGAPNN
jgi:hypothetical protein